MATRHGGSTACSEMKKSFHLHCEINNEWPGKNSSHPQISNGGPETKVKAVVNSCFHTPVQRNPALLDQPIFFLKAQVLCEISDDYERQNI